MGVLWRSKWFGLIICLISTVITLVYFLKHQTTSYLVINQNNFLFGEKAGNKLITPRTFIHSAQQEKRLKHLRDFCTANRDSYGISSLIRFLRTRDGNKAHLYISHTKRLVYCSVPKVASTNWKRLLLLFEGTIRNSEGSVKSEVHALPQLRLFKMISKEQIKRVLFHYYKFIFVRHPFERLASAYRNKFVEPNLYFRTTYGSRILRRYRRNLTELQYNQGRGVTFREFTQWLLDERVFDAHWTPIEKICHPCVLQYNFIGKMKTLVEDSEQVLHDIGSTEHFPANKTDGHKTSSEKLMYEYFSKLPVYMIQSLYERYKTDFLAFDYEIPQKILEQINKTAALEKMLYHHY